jgi:hypothetical protein
MRLPSVRCSTVVEVVFVVADVNEVALAVPCAVAGVMSWFVCAVTVVL